MTGKREYGDYQTPVDFADRVCRFLKEERKILPETVLEPTCGIGNFLKSSLVFNASQYYGIEIRPEYCEQCRNDIPDDKVSILNANFFEFDLKQIGREKLLVLGNPPWANNSMLSAAKSTNLPPKMNFKGRKGLDALTGASNFDICEYMILRLLGEYRNTDTTIAMLCKTSVARNVFTELERQKISFKSCEIFEFDAAKIFRISASACLLLIRLSRTECLPEYGTVCSFDEPQNIRAYLKYKNGILFSDQSDETADFEGKCCFEWRQGVKHDCSKIMELTREKGVLVNGKQEIADIEENLTFPLIKSSMFKKPVINSFTKEVIVTQKKVREDTSYIQIKYPKMWKYLNDNKIAFDSRKSSIYHGAPAFSMFGVGEYSYARYKVGISGFYKEPLFSLLYSPDGKPVMTDDTSYFICFSSYQDAYVAMLYLNSERVRAFVKKIAFLDAKRPYTKKVLERIDFEKICKEISYEELCRTEKELGLNPYITQAMRKSFEKETTEDQQRFA